MMVSLRPRRQNKMVESEMESEMESFVQLVHCFVSSLSDSEGIILYPQRKVKDQ